MKAPTRTLRSRTLDTSRWDGYRPRADDIIIGTYPKCGTTWMQRIVGMLVFQSAAPRALWDDSLWLDMRMYGPIESLLAAAETQTHRRFFKTHLPLDAVPIFPGVKVIHVARDGRDAALSFHNHLLNFTPGALEKFNEVSRSDPKFGDDYPPVPTSPAAFFADWVTDGGSQGDPGASFFHMETSYWDARDEPCMLLVHYNDLKADLGGEMRRVAAFLGIEVDASLWPDLIAAAGFEAMKAQGDALIPRAQHIFDRGSARFLNQGTNGRWHDVFLAEDLARYDAAVAANFSADLAHWVAHGRLAS